MDRAQVLEDFRDWVGSRIEMGILMLSGYALLEKLDELEELYE